MKGVIDIKKLLVLYVGFILLGLFLILNFSTNTTYAAVATQVTLDKVLSNTVDNKGVDRTLPKGLTNINELFNVPAITNNDTEVMPANTGDNKGSADVTVLTQLGQTNKVGAIWSKRTQSDTSKQNYINVDKRQTMSMWMYFGGVDSFGGTDTGDGMALVLQNVSDSAFTNGGDVANIPGEALGVWGTVVSPIDVVTSALAKTAIQKSWAMEFDTYPNSGTYDSNFDKNVSGFNHIASNYPARESTYGIGTEGAYMNHDNLITSIPTATRTSNFLTDDHWHHVTLTWTPAPSGSTDATMTLNYDDKNMDGTPKLTTAGKVNTKVMKVDTTAFDLNGSNKLYWGFTGSTGLSSENNLIIFESIPSLVEADATTSIIDETSGNREITDATTDNPNANVVHQGDKVSVNYNLNYLSGSKPWENIDATINLPDKIDYSSALITYTDDAGKTSTETIGEFSGMTNNQIEHKLGQSLYKTGITSANVKFEGTVNAGTTTTETDVPAAHASLYGSDLQKDVMTKAFVIKQPNKITLTKTGSDVTTSFNKEVLLNGKVSYSDKTKTVDPSKLTVVASVNGQVAKTSMNSILASNSTDTFALPVSSQLFSNLHEGANTVTIYVYNNEDYNVSDTITYTVTISGTVSLSASNSNFKTVQSFGDNSIIPRGSDWSINVTDSRQKGAGWKLFASATPLVNEDKETWTNSKDGQSLIFIDGSGNTNNLVNNEAEISGAVKSQTSAQDYDIDSQWSTSDGILLKRGSYESAGIYTSTITWNLQDSI